MLKMGPEGVSTETKGRLRFPLVLRLPVPVHFEGKGGSTSEGKRSFPWVGNGPGGSFNTF